MLFAVDFLRVLKARVVFRCAAVLVAVFVAQGAHAQVTPAAEVESTKLPALTINADRASLHDVTSESDRVGPANQPEWTTRRVFAETDVYVIPTGEIEFSQFYVSSHPRHGKPENGFESELEFGLPWRTQVDIEQSFTLQRGRLRNGSTFVEVPHALADWGRIPFNPAVVAGWRFRDGGDDSPVGRLLLAEEFKQRWHVGANIGFEREAGGEWEPEVTAAVSYVAKERRLAIGAEFLLEGEDEGAGGNSRVMAGPLVLYKPTRDTHLGVVSLFGLTSDSPVAEVFFIVGFDLEPFARRSGKGGDNNRDFGPVRRRK